MRAAFVIAILVIELTFPCRGLARLWNLTTAKGLTHERAVLDSLSSDSLWITDAASPTSVAIDEIVMLRAVPQPEIGGLWGCLVSAGVVGLKSLLGGFAPHRNEPLLDVGQSIGIVGIGVAMGVIAELGGAENFDFRLLTVDDRRTILRERVEVRTASLSWTPVRRSIFPAGGVTWQEKSTRESSGRMRCACR